MYSHAQDGPCDQVHDGLEPPKVEDDHVYCELKHCVLELQETHRFGVDHQRAQGVEQRLQEEPEHLPGWGAEEPPLQVRGDVHVQPVPPEVAVVIDVILLKRSGVRQSDGQVGPHGKPAVPLGQLVAERHIVGDVMDGQRQRVVNAAPEGVGPEKNPLPGQVPHQVAGQQLG